MRRHLPILLTTFTVGLAASASAQVGVRSSVAPAGPQVTREDVVERLMAFDRNYDGQVARAELPERMHDMLTRGDKDKNQVLDAKEVRQLAASPVSRPAAAREFQPGQYGFGESFGLDSRLHIEGAIDDLRLAHKERDAAVEIARRFQDARDREAKSDLLEAMGRMLTSGALEDFITSLDRQPARVVRFSPGVAGAVTVAPEAPFRQIEAVLTRARAATNAARLIDKYGLQPAEQEKARAAIDFFTERTSGRLTDADRSALLRELQSVLDDGQLDDLRAALDRRPIVKQGGHTFVVNGQQMVFPTPQSGRIQNLVFREQ